MDIVNELLEKAEAQGYLTIDDVLESLATLDEDESLENILSELKLAGIEIETADDLDIEGPTFDEVIEEEKEELESLDDNSDLDGIGVDDTVALYLREMARVPLLSNEEEVTLAKKNRKR
jgi:RNA polymerase primary sigma factor